MKNIILTAAMLVTLSACNTTTTADNNGTQPHRVAGSDARKTYCKQMNTHTVKDYHDCVKGYSGQHKHYAIGVTHPEKITQE